jgi:hypothetical protein
LGLTQAEHVASQQRLQKVLEEEHQKMKANFDELEVRLAALTLDKKVFLT